MIRGFVRITSVVTFNENDAERRPICSRRSNWFLGCTRVMKAFRNFLYDSAADSNPGRAWHTSELYLAAAAVGKISSVNTVKLTLVLLSIIWSAGCGNKFFDPTQIGRFRPVPAESVILDTLGVAEEEPPTWEGAEPPRPVDIMVFNTDYVFGPGDVVRISIFELLQEGRAFENDYFVTETGKISIPEVGTVEAAGLTESQLEEEIRQILSPGILKEPSVSVILRGSQQRAFSILGDGIPKPARYSIPRYDYRLTDALATAGGISQFNTSYIYVSRPITGREPVTGPAMPPSAEPRQLTEPGENMLEIIAPYAQRPSSPSQLVIAGAEMATSNELKELALPEGFDHTTGQDSQPLYKTASSAQAFAEPPARETIDKPINDQGRIEWVFQDGRWIPVQVSAPQAPPGPPAGDKFRLPEDQIPPGPLKQKIPEQFDWEQVQTAGVQARVIEIPADSLLGGDPRYNIIIRPGDTIHVPVDIIGEFCIMGNVNRQGYIPLTGRPMTLKMSIAAAGGLGPLAWPKSCEVVRRIGKNREETVMVDLERIASGQQPDFYIKPNDLINVGTHYTARWRAVLRNSFRATYGFGFIYDRNFADRDYYTSRPIPDWF